MPGSGKIKYALIVAGGTGSRMGCGTPKQFLSLGDRPILMKTIEVFHRCCDGIRIILVLHPGMIDHWHRLCSEYGFDVPLQLAAGGRERYDSVRNGLELVTEEGLVAVHDGVRPLVSERLIADAFTLAEAFGAAVPVMPLNETIREIREGQARVVDRSYLFTVQTPQAFATSLLKRAYLQEYRKEFTDDATLVEALGHRIHFFPGESRNIKITRQEDLALAELMI